MQQIPLYLLMVSFGRRDSAISVIQDFLNAGKPDVKTKFIVIENGPAQTLNREFDFLKAPNIQYLYFADQNKAKAINLAISKSIPEEDALIICVDNDISFRKDFLLNYQFTASNMGPEYYFGGSFYVTLPKGLDEKLIPYLSGSALGKPDKEFEQMKKLMFMGCSYAFYKNQWKEVKGLDERFSPGSIYNLAAEESIFQKKLRHAGFKPFFVKENPVEHKPSKDVYLERKVAERRENDGYTHGFQDIILNGYLNYGKRLVFLGNGLIKSWLHRDQLGGKMKFAYFKGYLKAQQLYWKIDDRRSYLDF